MIVQGILVLLTVGCSSSVDLLPRTDGGEGEDAAVATDAGRSLDAADADSIIDAGSPTDEPLCTPSGFCWVHPHPHGGQVYGVAGLADGSVFLATETLPLLAVRDERYRDLSPAFREALGPRPARSHVRSGSVSLHAFADDGLVYHLRGARVSAVVLYRGGELERLPDLTFEGDDAHVAVDESGEVFHLSQLAGRPRLRRRVGATFVEVPLGTEQRLLALTALKSGDVVATGAYGALLHITARGAERVDLGIEEDLHGAFGASLEDLWVYGEGHLYHHDGRDTVPLAELDVRAAHTENVDDIWIAAAEGLFHWDGLLLSRVRSEPAWQVGGAPGGDVWVIGAYGAVIRYDGTRWTGDSPLVTNGVTDHWVAEDGQVWMSTFRGLVRWDGDKWDPVLCSGPARLERLSPLPFFGVTGTAPDDVWAVGAHMTVAHWDGRECTITQLLVEGTRFSSVWAHGSEAWAFDDEGRAFRYDDAEWTQRPYEGTGIVRRLHGSGAGDVWALAIDADNQWWLNGFDGSSWATVSQLGASFEALWVAGPNDVWVMGRSAVHWDGKVLTEAVSEAWVYGIGADSDGQLWAAGTGVVRLEGGQWRAVDMGGPASGTVRWRGLSWAADRLWLVGGGGQLLTRSGGER